MKIAFIGGGNMGEAILAAVLEKGLASPHDICVSDISRERRDYLERKHGVAVTDNTAEAVKNKDIVVLAVKPQNIADIPEAIEKSLQPEQLVLSIIAGVKMATIGKLLNHERIVRVMPNTPAQIGVGMSGWTATSQVTVEQKERARSILNAMGKEIYFDDEEYLDKVTAISGSGPAYVFLFAECLADATADIGLSRDEAVTLVSQTVLGAARLISESGETPAELRRKVSSKGGTTERALQVFAEGGLKDIVRKAVQAAYDRAKELGS
ncbi:MAG: pyrroline-5-carboxylate reductase [Dehalococcoidia bacterium]|jgi:pyrroline-5-carboxylate reductase